MNFRFGERGLIAWPYATTKRRNVRFDRTPFRGPFGETVRTAGVGTPEAVTVDVSVRIPETPPEAFDLTTEDGRVLTTEAGEPIGLTQFETIDDFVREVEQAERLETEFWDARVAALSRVSVVPVVPGFRVDLSFVVQDEPQFAFVLVTEDERVLTTEDGRILEVNL